MITTEPVIIISLECIQSIQYPVSLAMTGLVARVLLVMTTLAEGGRGEEEPPCMISCCLACSPGYNCQVCYQLNKSDPLNCPCVATFNPSDLSLLADFSRVSSAGSIRLEEARTEEENTVELKISKQRELACRPLCCPTISCTPTTCPNCFRRNTVQPRQCPCIEIK